jgi:hypothetical protein
MKYLTNSKPHSHKEILTWLIIYSAATSPGSIETFTN